LCQSPWPWLSDFVAPLEKTDCLASGVQLHTIGGFLATNAAFSGWGNILYSTTIVTGIQPGGVAECDASRSKPQRGDTAHSENKFFKSRLLSINIRRAAMKNN
jgi:hypothetical protein